MDLFKEVSTSPWVGDLCAKIAAEPDHDRRSNLKKQLPVVTWHASFPGARKNAEAVPSGLVMLDIDHCDDPAALWRSVEPRTEELGILLAHITPSAKGLRLVFRCRPEFTTLAECQQWMAVQMGTAFDSACKDFARASFVVPQSHVLFLDERLFTDEPDVVYDVNDGEASPSLSSSLATPSAPPPSLAEPPQLDFMGIPLATIARAWLMHTGGEPAEGVRNNRLRQLALRLRHITDYNEQTLLAVMPNYGLGENEMRHLIHSACQADSKAEIPRDLQEVLAKLSTEPKRMDLAAETELTMLTKRTVPEKLPPLPPLFKELVTAAPPDFRAAVALCMLPIVGTLGSKLRARYRDGKLHSPSFQVSLEAPQASGKGFMNQTAKRLLWPIAERDQEGRDREREYEEKLRQEQQRSKRRNGESDDSVLPPEPHEMVRWLPPTVSSSKLLKRMEDAKGLHLFILAEEVDTVRKAFGRSCSSYSDVLRVAFDNDDYGQDYIKSDTYNGKVQLYINTLFSGTHGAMCKFYPNLEDGTVSRVCFVTLPDQLGKPMPVWRELREAEAAEVKRQVERLDEVSFRDGKVQPDYLMDLNWLNKDLEKWTDDQQRIAVLTEDRTLDTFCRRAAVVGFRAGMLAWFLYGENPKGGARNKVKRFARWVADCMLNQHMQRFVLDDTSSNTTRWSRVLDLLPAEFSGDDADRALATAGVRTPLKNVLSRWHRAGNVECLSPAGMPAGEKRYRKLKG